MGLARPIFLPWSMARLRVESVNKKMTLNLMVSVREIRFVIFDDREPSVSHGLFQEIVISKLDYYRLTVPPTDPSIIDFFLVGVGGSICRFVSIYEVRNADTIFFLPIC